VQTVRNPPPRDSGNRNAAPFSFQSVSSKITIQKRSSLNALSRAITVPFAKQLIISPARAVLPSVRWFFATILLRLMQNAIAAWPAKNLISAFYIVFMWNLSSPPPWQCFTA
jgi:hypothetical protein